MDEFSKIIDYYLLNYSLFKKGKVEFNCNYGELIFFKNNDNTLILHGIYILPEYRKKGLCRQILIYIIDKSKNGEYRDKFNYFCVQSVMSKILYNYLLRFKYNEKKFKNTKNGFIYNIDK